MIRVSHFHHSNDACLDHLINDEIEEKIDKGWKLIDIKYSSSVANGNNSYNQLFLFSALLIFDDSPTETPQQLNQ